MRAIRLSEPRWRWRDLKCSACLVVPGGHLLCWFESEAQSKWLAERFHILRKKCRQGWSSALHFSTNLELELTQNIQGAFLSSIFLLQPLPTCPNISVASTRLPPTLTLAPAPSSSHIADLLKCACLLAGLMRCPATGPGLVGRHVPLRALRRKPLLILPSPLRTSLGQTSLTLPPPCSPSQPPIGRAVMRHRNRPGSEPQIQRGPSGWGHRWGMWVRLIVIMAQQKGPPLFPLSHCLSTL